MIVLGIDPGIKNIGVALINTEGPLLLHSAWNHDGVEFKWPLSGLSIPSLIVVERPVGFAKAAGQMIKVAFNAGYLLARFQMIYPGSEGKMAEAGRNGWQKFYGRDFDPRWKCEELFGSEKTTSLSAHEIDAALMAYAISITK